MSDPPPECVPAVPDPTTIFNLACDLLNTAEGCLVANCLPVPDRVYVSPCEPDTFCCSNLVVVPTRIEIVEDPNSTGRNCLYRRVMHFDLWIERCVNVFTNDGQEPPLGSCAEPNPGTISGDALAVLTDRWVILECLLGSLRALGEDSPIWCCKPVSIIAVENVCEGLCAGTRFEITVTI